MHTELSHLIRAMSPFLDRLGLPIAIIDTDGRYVYYNQESAQIDGCTVEFALGKRLLDIYPNMSAENSTMLRALKGEVFERHQQNYFNAKGRLIQYAHTTTPLFDDKTRTVVGAIEIGIDLSKEEKLQGEILKLNAQLTRTQTANTNVLQYDKARQAIITQNPKMLALIELAERYAKSTVPIVITGESGTGKELLANLIHATSDRAHHPMVVLNCGAFPETLIESSLFGTVKGAYTGAENREGLLASANKGTLFLDEFNAMPLSMQVKLLRFLQEKTFTKVGDRTTQTSDVRIVVAMNEPPENLIAEKRLREDLYWRLAVAKLTIPPLRERPDDILLLAEHFVSKYRQESSHTVTGFSHQAKHILLTDAWNGNVRRLENAIIRSLILHSQDGPLEVVQLNDENDPTPLSSPPQNQWRQDNLENSSLTSTHRDTSYNATETSSNLKRVPGQTLKETLEQFERRCIVEALNQAEGNIQAAATSLGLQRTTLHYKMQKYRIRLGVIH